MTRELLLTTRELNLESIIRYGLQNLRFDVFRCDENKEYLLIEGVVRDRIWQFRRVDERRITYQVLGRFNGALEEEDEAVVRDFFQLDVNVVELYAEWSEDEKFKSLVDANRSKLEGIRILKPGVLEAFVSNIAFYYGEPKYVKTYLDRLCKFCGESLEVLVDGFPQTFYNFPTYDRLVEDLDKLDEDLKKNRFGPGRVRVIQFLRELQELGGIEWLENQGKHGSRKAFKRITANFSSIIHNCAAGFCNSAYGMSKYVPVTSKLYSVTTPLYLPNFPRSRPATYKRFDQELHKLCCKKFPNHTAWAAQVFLASGELKIQSITGTPAYSTKARDDPNFEFNVINR